MQQRRSESYHEANNLTTGEIHRPITFDQGCFAWRLISSLRKRAGLEGENIVKPRTKPNQESDPILRSLVQNKYPQNANMFVVSACIRFAV